MGTIYERIRELRIKKGLTQLELAERLGYTNRSTIAKIEAGKRDFPQSKLNDFAKALGVSEVDILGVEEEFDRTVFNNYKLLDEDDQVNVMEYIAYLLSKPKYLGVRKRV